ITNILVGTCTLFPNKTKPAVLIPDNIKNNANVFTVIRCTIINIFGTCLYSVFLLGVKINLYNQMTVKKIIINPITYIIFSIQNHHSFLISSLFLPQRDKS